MLGGGLPALRKRAPFTKKRSGISLGCTLDHRIDVGNERRRKHSAARLPPNAEAREREKLSLNRSLISKVGRLIENAVAELLSRRRAWYRSERASLNRLKVIPLLFTTRRNIS